MYGVWEQNQVPITVTAGANGTITPGSTTVGWGDSASFVVKANDKYKIDTLTVDGSPVSFNPNNASYVTEYTLTLNDVRSTHLIEATFVEIVSLTIDVQNQEYTNGCYIYHTDYDSTTTTTEEVFFYIKPLPGFIFKGWANKNGEIISTNPFETFEFVKDNAYYYLAVLEVAPERAYYSINTAGELLEFVNVAQYSQNHLAGVQVYLNQDIDLTNIDLFTMYNFETFPNASAFAGYFEYNGYTITKDGKYFNILTGELSDTPIGNGGDFVID